MVDSDRTFDPRNITYEELQDYIARGRALRAAHMAASFAALGRLLTGRSAQRKDHARPTASSVRPA